MFTHLAGKLYTPVMRKAFPIIICLVVLIAFCSCASTDRGPIEIQNCIRISVTDLDFEQRGSLATTVRNADAKHGISNAQIASLDGKVGFIYPEELRAYEDALNVCYKVEFEDGTVLYYTCQKRYFEYTDIYNEPYIEKVFE